jgi:DNA-binding SARP family transcriptional activator
MATSLDPRHRTLPPPHGGQRLAAGVGAALAIGVVLVAVPWGLLTFTRWPVSGVPSWQQIEDLPASAASDEAIIAVFVVGLWAAWAVFALSIVLEVIAQIRGRDVRRVPGLAPIQLAARNLVAVVAMAIGTVGSGSTGVAHATPMSTPAAASVNVSPTAAFVTTPEPAAGSTAASGWQHVTVGDGDTAWGIAEIHYGDGAESRRLWLDNRDRIQPDGTHWEAEGDPVEAGWILRVRSTPQPTTTAGQEPAPYGEVIAQPGDSLWSIAAAELAERKGQPASDAETRTFWQATVELNTDHLHSGDPDVIYAGEVVLLPDSPAPAEPQAPPPETPAPEPTAPVSPPSTTSTPSTSAPSTTSTTTPPTTAPVLVTFSASPSDTAPNTTSEPDTDERVPIVSTIRTTAVLAGLALVALARRRRARRRAIRPGTATGPRLADDIDTERALACAEDETLELLRAAVRAFSDVLSQAPDTPPVTGVVVDADAGEVTVHLSEPAAPVAPFVDDPAGAGHWLLPAGIEQEETDEPVVPVLETLVTLGRAEGGEWVFIDLESLGSLSLEGDPDRAEALAQSLAAELMLQPLDHYVDVTIAGDLDTLSAAEQGTVHTPRLDQDLVQAHEQHGRDTASWIADEGFTSSVIARAQGLPRDGLVVSAVVIGPDADPVLVDRLVEAAAPGGRGLAVVSLTPPDPSVSRILVGDDGWIDVPHLGLMVQAAELPSDDLSRMDQLLANEPTTVTEIPHALQDNHDDQVDDGYEPPTWERCVRVFADLEVTTSEDVALSFRFGENPLVTNKNTSRGPELIAYLALRPDRSATRDEVRDHLWWKRPISARSVETLIGGARKVLGGDDYLTRGIGQGTHRRYELAPTVITDVDLLEHAIHYAHRATNPTAALAALREPLQRIETEAFRPDHMGHGISEWAAAYRIVDRVEQPVIDATLLAVELLADAGAAGIPEAQRLLDYALRACPTNEALTRAAMLLDARAGHREAAQARYQALATRLAQDDLEPEEATVALRAEIMAPTYRIG